MLKIPFPFVPYLLPDLNLKSSGVMSREREKMGRDALSIGVRIRKFIDVSIRFSFRSVCNHPFLVGFLCFLIFLYRSFPFLFSLLVSASPVFVCTALLLGTILSFGQPNIPEIEKEEEVSCIHDVASLRAGGVSEDVTTVVERDGDFCVERYSGERRDIGGEVIEEVSSARVETSEVEEEDDDDDYSSVENERLIHGNPGDIQIEKLVNDAVERNFHDLELEMKRETKIFMEERASGGVESDREVVMNEYTLIEEAGNDKLPRESVDQAGDTVDSSPGSSWKPEEDADEDDGESESESDRAESSSPDASIADILPMLDELCPLLELGDPQPAPVLSRDGSDTASEQSHRTNDDNEDSDEDTEKEEEEKGEADGDEENDDEEEAPAGKENGSKSAISWTEDDEKNLMDLGTLELERNQRLESLIARRQARKSFKMMDEKNLIDLDSADVPSTIPPISTVRRNPFDFPSESYENMGLPPIPGSAPSILLPRRNPFDLPYDPNEEKPDLKEDSFQEEFMPLHQQKNTAVFRRHESFSVGPSGFGVSKLERQDIRWRPYFVPEHLASEGTSFHPFQRQLSSESKASSVPDTESESSADPSFHGQLNEVSSADPSSHRQLSEVADESKFSVPDKIVTSEDQDHMKLSGEDSFHETELMSNIDHASDHVESGSQSSDDPDSVGIEHVERRDIIHDEVELTLGALENHHEIDPCSSEAVGTTTLVEVGTGEIHLRAEAMEHEYSSRSSTSSISEINRMITDVKEEESMSLEPRGNTIEEFGISTQPSFEESYLNFPGEVADDSQHKEPVYDSSPPADDKCLSLSSISSDLQGEVSEMEATTHPVSIETIVSFVDKKAEVPSETTERENSVIEEMYAASSQLYEGDEAESRLTDVVEIIEHTNDREIVSSCIDQNVGNADGSVVPLSVDIHVSTVSSLPSSDVGLVEDSMMDKEDHHGEQDQVETLGLDEPIIVEVQEDIREKFDPALSSSQKPSEASSLYEREDQQSSNLFEHDQVVHPDLSVTGTEPVELKQDQVRSSSSSDYGSVEGVIIYEDRSAQHVQDQVDPLRFDSEINVVDYQGAGERSDSAPEEQQTSLVVDQALVLLPTSSSSETEYVEEHSSIEEANLQSEHVQVHSSRSEENIDGILHRDLDVEIVSSVPIQEKYPSELEKQLHWADKSMVEVEPSFDGHELQGSSIILTESVDEVGITNNVIVPEIYNPDVKDLPDHSSLVLHSATTTIASESPEYLSPSAGMDFNDDMINQISGHDHPGSEYGSHVAEQNINGEAEEIREIDDRLLTELDTVGDFGYKDESSNDLMISEGTNPVDTEIRLLDTDPNLVKANSELPVLEEISPEDMDVTIKQRREGADVKEVILPTSVKEHLGSDSSNGSVETYSGMPVTLKPPSEFHQTELPSQLSSTDGSAVEATEAGSTKESESSNSEPHIEQNRANVTTKGD